MNPSLHNVADLERIKELEAELAEMKLHLQEDDATMGNLLARAEKAEAEAGQGRVLYELLLRDSKMEVSSLEAEVERLREKMNEMPSLVDNECAAIFEQFLAEGVNPSGDTLGRKERDG